ncbi:MAG TPA: DUF4126 domain-containing protein [Thermoanaerobaculia bacterium]|nr:DUF4126 domain-containing protein [Thermoanaerobaculia bacterium]
METVLAIALGLALSAACGFRIFVPLLALGAAQATGHLTLAPSFEWLGTPTALLVLGVATAAEIVAYYVPWLDNLLDSLATPAALVAGTVVTASVVTDLDPLWRWSLAVIAGGGLAGAVQTSTTLLRAASTGSTAGLANPLLATGELGGAVAISIAALVVPLLALAAVIAGLVLAIVWVRRRRAARAAGSRAAIERSAAAPGSDLPERAPQPW